MFVEESTTGIIVCNHNNSLKFYAIGVFKCMRKFLCFEDTHIVSVSNTNLS